MIIENNPKSLPWLLFFALVCGGLIVFFWQESQDPARQAEVARMWQENEQRAHEWQLKQQTLQAQAQAEVDRINNERWLAAQRTQQQAQSEAAMMQIGLVAAYVGVAVIGLPIGVGLLGLTLLVLVLLWQRWLGNPWRDPAYRRRERELARELERLSRRPASAPQKLNGKAYTPEPENETHPPI